MIPYFFWNAIHIGPLTLQVWGLFVSVGALIALIIAQKIGRTHNLSKETILDLFFWLLVSGLIVGRLFYVIFYNPLFFLQNPLEIFMVWHGGASSLGGWVGAGIAAYIYCKMHKLNLVNFLGYADVLALGLWAGWAIGRIGCFLIHDHIGVLSNSFLAVAYPGGARLDLGLSESILAAIIFIIFILLYKKIIHQPGRILAYSFMIYSAARFALDFFRATDIEGFDVRYALLTPAQWGMLILFGGLTIWLIRDKISQRKKISGRVA
ncbi:MAG: prolipoprotein diacylglyceryl transferase [Candidatus Magasanikbacteria bacterium]|nr:prolipoprotein diacylglyceryl transferase [Candidatus Magasanikbacteria bacterium]